MLTDLIYAHLIYNNILLADQNGEKSHVLIQCFKIVNPGYMKRKTPYFRKLLADHESTLRKIPNRCRLRVLFKAVFVGVKNVVFDPKIRVFTVINRI